MITMIYFILFFIYFLFFFFFRAALTAYGGSQARGLMEGMATGLRHSSTRSEARLTYTTVHGNTSLSPLSGARDRTWVLINTSQVCNHWAMARTPLVTSRFKNFGGILQWCSGLRIRCCHYSGLGQCCDAGLIPALGSSLCLRQGQKKKKGGGEILFSFYTN